MVWLINILMVVLIIMFIFRLYQEYRSVGLFPTLLALFFAVLGGGLYFFLRWLLFDYIILNALIMVLYINVASYLSKKILQKHCSK